MPLINIAKVLQLGAKIAIVFSIQDGMQVSTKKKKITE
jgi:hypothetical protein